MVAYFTRFGVGFAGDTHSRQEANTTEAQTFNPLNMPTAFGIPVKFATTNGVTNVEPSVTAGDAAATIGFLARPYPDINGTGSTDAAFGGETPRIGVMANVLRRGYIIVKLQTGDYTAATCLKGTPVYLRTTAATGPTRVVGGLADSSGGAGTTVIPNAFFNGPPDASGFTEIYYNL